MRTGGGVATTLSPGVPGGAGVILPRVVACRQLACERMACSWAPRAVSVRVAAIGVGAMGVVARVLPLLMYRCASRVRGGTCRSTEHERSAERRQDHDHHERAEP